MIIVMSEDALCSMHDYYVFAVLLCEERDRVYIFT